MVILRQTIYAALSVLFFSIVLNAPKRTLAYASLTGSLGWLVYLLIENYSSTVYATFIASCVIALFSHIFSRIFKTPTTIFLISALHPFVPGTSVYKAVYYLLLNNQNAVSFHASQSLLISGAIATAVFMIDSIFLVSKKIKRVKIK